MSKIINIINYLVIYKPYLLSDTVHLLPIDLAFIIQKIVSNHFKNSTKILPTITVLKILKYVNQSRKEM